MNSSFFLIEDCSNANVNEKMQKKCEHDYWQNEQWARQIVKKKVIGLYSDKIEDFRYSNLHIKMPWGFLNMYVYRQVDLTLTIIYDGCLMLLVHQIWIQ